MLTRAIVRAGQCAPNTTTSLTRLSPPPPCAERARGRPGGAASRLRAISRFHRPGAVLTRAVVRVRAVRPDNDYIADATVTSAAVRQQRRRFAPEGDLALSPA